MPAVVREQCGVQHVASAWQPTKMLVEAADVTYDGVHWLLAVNLLKAHAIVDVAAKMLNSTRPS